MPGVFSLSSVRMCLCRVRGGFDSGREVRQGVHMSSMNTKNKPRAQKHQRLKHKQDTQTYFGGFEGEFGELVNL